MPDIVIQAENLSKQYRLGVIGTGTLTHDLQSWWARMRGHEDPNRRISHAGGRAPRAEKAGDEYLWALKDVSFEVRQGEVLGIIGRNGAGKSTLLKILSRVTAPTSGTVKIKGRVASLLEVGTGFHPELTGRENIYLNGAILGMTRREIDGKFDEIVDFAEVEQFIDTPVKRYSSGMYVRLAFAVAAHLEPEILVVDEVLAVGDVAFQKKCLGKMGDVAKEGRTVLFVSHNMAAVNNLCKLTVLISNGRNLFSGESADVINYYLGFHKDEKAGKLTLSSRVIDITRIRIFNSRSKYVKNIPWDEVFFIKIEYNVKIKTSGLSIGIVVHSSNGEIVFTSVSRSSINGKELQKGCGFSTVQIPGRLLAPGKYYCYLNAHTVFDTFCYDENALSFSIIEKGREILGREGQMHWPGLISPVLRWENHVQRKRAN
jgi:lipopolysaccharide transport system ATP-binding protein